MPKFVLADPDGQQYEIGFPDGTPDAVIRAKVDEIKQGWRGNKAREAFAQNIDRSPVQKLPTRITSPSLPGGVDIGGSQDNPSEALILNNAAENGIDIYTGLDANLRATADTLDLNPSAKAAALEYLVAKQLKEQGIELPPGIPAVWKEEFSGRTAYWRPTENGLKATLVNPAGFDGGDALESIDDVAQVGLEAAAAFGGAIGGGALTGGSPAGAVGGGAAAVAAANGAAEKARKEVARSLGIPDEIVEQITSDDLLNEALLAGGFEILGPAAVGAVRMARNRWASGGLDAADVDIEQIKKFVGEMSKVSDELYEATGVRITPSLGGVSGNETILVAEANAKRDAIGAKSAALRESEIRNRAATGNAIRAIHSGEIQTMPGLDVPSEMLGEKAQDVLTRPRATAAEIEAKALRDQESQMNEAASRWNHERYAGIQKDLRFASEKAQEVETLMWDNYRTQVELDPETSLSNIVLRNTGDAPIPQALAKISRESQAALSDSLRASQQKLVEDLGWKVDPETGMIPRQNLADATLDANGLHVLLSHLKKERRKEAASIGNLGWREGDLDTMITAIEDQMKSGQWARRSSGRAVNPEKARAISASWALANEASIAKHNMFNTKAVKELLKTNPDGTFAKQPGAVRSLLFKPGDAESLNDVLGIVGQNPAKRAAMLDELNTLYRENVFTADGKFSKGQHDAFLSRYSDHIRLLTDDESTDFIRNAADFANVVKKAEKRRDKVEGLLSNAYGRKLTGEDVYAGNVASDMLSDQLSLKQIETIRNRLNREDPALWGEIKAQGLLVLEEKLLKSGGNEANSRVLSKLLVEDRGRLGTIYGPQYVKNLENMQELLRAMETGQLARGSKIALNPPALQALRSLIGPLSPIQRRITAAVRIDQAWRRNNLSKLMSDPDQLDSLVKWSRMKPNTIASIQAGFSVFGDAYEEIMSDEQRELAEKLASRRGPDSDPIKTLRAVNERRRQERSAVLN